MPCLIWTSTNKLSSGGHLIVYMFCLTSLIIYTEPDQLVGTFLLMLELKKTFIRVQDEIWPKILRLLTTLRKMYQLILHISELQLWKSSGPVYASMTQTDRRPLLLNVFSVSDYLFILYICVSVRVAAHRHQKHRICHHPETDAAGWQWFVSYQRLSDSFSLSNAWMVNSHCTLDRVPNSNKALSAMAWTWILSIIRFYFFTCSVNWHDWNLMGTISL